MKKLFILFSIIILVFPVVSAYQLKMTVKECLISFNDPDFNLWNEATQSGVFLNYSNTNLNLGQDENQNFIVTNYQPVRKYFNNFNYSDVDSSIPILQISDEENMIYTQCKYKIGDQRIVPSSTGILHGGPGGISLYTTQDFNLSNGLFEQTSYPSRLINMAGKLNPSSSLYPQMALAKPIDIKRVYYFDII